MKSPDEIKCHSFQLEKITYIPTLAGFCFPFGLLHRFGGHSFEVFGVAFHRRSQGWTELFRKSCTAKPFSRRSLNPLLDFSSNAKKHSPFVPFFGQLGKIFFSRSNLNDFCFTTGAFNFSPYLVTLLSTTAQLEIKISDRSSMTTATYMTGAQSKASIKLC